MIILFIVIISFIFFVWALNKGQHPISDTADEICLIDPQKDIYYSLVDEISGVEKFDFSRYNLYLDGRRKYKGDDKYERIIVGNDMEELKLKKAEILQEKIYNPTYPKTIKIKLNIHDKIICGDLKKKIVNSTDIVDLWKSYECLRYEDGEWIRVPQGYYSHITLSDGISYETDFESPEEYDERLRSKALQREEERLNNILTQIDNLTK